MSRTTEAIKYAIDSRLIEVDLDNGGVIGVRGKPLKPGLSGVGKRQYYAVNIPTPDGKQILVQVHRIVGYVVFGDAALDSGVEIDHIDRNKFNNHPFNLRLSNRSGNAFNNPPETWLRKVTPELVDKLYTYTKLGWTIEQIAKYVDLSVGTVNNILRGRYNHKTVELNPYAIPELSGRGGSSIKTGLEDFWHDVNDDLPYSYLQNKYGISISAISYRISREAKRVNSPYRDVALSRIERNKDVENTKDKIRTVYRSRLDRYRD